MNHLSISSLYSDLKSRLEFLRSNHSEVERYEQVISDALADGGTYYGINTGFGALATSRIESKLVEELQQNFLLSHAVGVGPLVSKELCELMLGLKVHAIGLGHSGVSRATFARMLHFLKEGLIPAVKEQGSVGASGDLAPLSHLALPLIGEGVFWNADGTDTISAAEVLRKAKLKPLRLKAKEGLALTNGTQFMTAHGSYVLERAQSLIKLCDVIGAMSLDALQGSLSPFDARVGELRPHPGQIASAKNIRQLLAGSQILSAHVDCEKVQDPYSLRCMAVVHGASRDALEHAKEVVEREINSVTDNPLIFDNGDILSAGNFHGQPVALALDYAAIALAELASISERRSYLLLSGHDGLPKLLLKETGLHTGFMIPQYTQASLVSENKVLAHPCSVDSIPTSLGQEDHVSMGSVGAVKLLRVLRNLEHVLGIELLFAAQALDFRRPLCSGAGLEEVHEHIRKEIPHRTGDASFQADFEKVFELIRSQILIDCAEAKVGELQ